MKNLKLLLVLVAMILSSFVSAKEIPNLVNPDSVSVEIERMLKDMDVANECEPFEVTVFFSVSDDQKIQSLSVASPNEKVNDRIQKQLINKQLPTTYWRKGKIYELTVISKVS